MLNILYASLGCHWIDDDQGFTFHVCSGSNELYLVPFSFVQNETGTGARPVSFGNNLSQLL